MRIIDEIPFGNDKVAASICGCGMCWEGWDVYSSQPIPYPMLFGLFDRNDLKSKVKKIKRQIKETASKKSAEKVWINQIGAYDIHPKHLYFCVCVKTDNEKKRLLSDSEFMKQLRQILFDFQYPKDGIDHVEIGVESQETVDRESEGNWFFHFK